LDLPKRLYTLRPLVHDAWRRQPGFRRVAAVRIGRGIADTILLL
jgi:hypothetical protein